MSDIGLGLAELRNRFADAASSSTKECVNEWIPGSGATPSVPDSKPVALIAEIIPLPLGRMIEGTAWHQSKIRRTSPSCSAKMGDSPLDSSSAGFSVSPYRRRLLFLVSHAEPNRTSGNIRDPNRPGCRPRHVLVPVPAIVDDEQRPLATVLCSKVANTVGCL